MSAGATAVLAGCATPITLSDGTRTRIFVPCSNDALCIRNGYGIAREDSGNDYPVSFRNNEYEYTTKKREWILKSGEVTPPGPAEIDR